MGQDGGRVETNGYTPGQQTKTSHVYTYDTAANKFTDELRITHENGTDESSTVTYTVQQNEPALKPQTKSRPIAIRDTSVRFSRRT